MRYEVDGFRTVMTEQTYPSMVGKLRVRVLAYLPDDPMPTVVAAVAMLVQIEHVWFIGHVLVEDDARRHGICERIVLAVEREHDGPLHCCWASDSGVAFAKRFTEKHGPRPTWQVGGDPRIEAALAELAVTR